jgi:hypothetical protein
VGGWSVSPGEVTAFMNASKNLYNLKAVNFWEWYNATVYLPYCWDEISAFEWGGVTPPSLEQRVTALENEARAHGWNV